MNLKTLATAPAQSKPIQASADRDFVSQDRRIGVAPAEDRVELPAMQPRCAIVADDVPGIRAVIAQILEPEGFKVLGAESGHEAAKLLRANRCELLITDVLMPDGDGIELINELKKTDGTVRILAISGGGRALDPDYCVKLAKAMGAHAGIMKPFNRAQLLAAVNNALAPASI